MGDDIATCRFSALLVFLVCCVVGCDDSNGLEPCSDPPGVISVSGGPNPTITWDAECEAQIVAVFDPRTGFDVWRLSADTRRIPKPVVYGVVPVGAKEPHAAEPLQPGMGYGVYVGIVVGADTAGSIGGFTP